MIVKEKWLNSAERGLCVVNTLLEHNSLHKCTRMAKGQEGVKVKSMIDLVAGEKGYVALCSECEGSERNGTWPLGSPYCTA